MMLLLLLGGGSGGGPTGFCTSPRYGPGLGILTIKQIVIIKRFLFLKRFLIALKTVHTEDGGFSGSKDDVENCKVTVA